MAKIDSRPTEGSGIGGELMNWKKKKKTLGEAIQDARRHNNYRDC